MGHPTVQQLLDELNQLDECDRIEAKACSTQLSESVWETISAFANEPGMDGGYIVFGVQKTQDTFIPSYSVIGVQNSDQMQADLASQCSGLFNVPIRPYIMREKIEGKVVVAAYIPEMPGGSKPVYIAKKNLPRGAFRRIGSTDQHCTSDDLQALYSSSLDSPDSGAVNHGSVSEFDQEMIDEYRGHLLQSNPQTETRHWSDNDLLKACSGITINGGNTTPTVGGVLIFATRKELRRLLPAMRIDYIRVPGKEWVENPDVRYDTIELRDPLPALIRRAIATAFDDIPKSFALPEGSSQRVDVPLIPANALREAIVNSVMHRSYTINGAIQIIRFSNRIEIHNPGHSLLNLDPMGGPGSQTRNPIIAEVLREMRFAEAKGTGIRVMREKMEAAKLPPATFVSDRVKNRFVAKFLFHHFLSSTDIDWLGAIGGGSLSSEQARALIYAREVGTITPFSYRELNRASPVEAAKALHQLYTMRLIVPAGNKNASTFQLSDDAAGAFGIQPRSTYKTEGGSAASKRIRYPELPADIALLIKNARKSRKREDYRILVYTLCRIQPMKISELASFLGKSPELIRRDYVAPLLQRGLLHLTNPEAPTSPNQSYAAVQSHSVEEGVGKL